MSRHCHRPLPLPPIMPARQRAGRRLLKIPLRQRNCPVISRASPPPSSASTLAPSPIAQSRYANTKRAQPFQDRHLQPVVAVTCTGWMTAAGIGDPWVLTRPPVCCVRTEGGAPRQPCWPGHALRTLHRVTTIPSPSSYVVSRALSTAIRTPTPSHRADYASPRRPSTSRSAAASPTCRRSSPWIYGPPRARYLCAVAEESLDGGPSIVLAEAHSGTSGVDEVARGVGGRWEGGEEEASGAECGWNGARCESGGRCEQGGGCDGARAIRLAASRYAAVLSSSCSLPSPRVPDTAGIPVQAPPSRSALSARAFATSPRRSSRVPANAYPSPLVGRRGGGGLVIGVWVGRRRRLGKNGGVLNVNRTERVVDPGIEIFESQAITGSGVVLRFQRRVASRTVRRSRRHAPRATCASRYKTVYILGDLALMRDESEAGTSGADEVARRWFGGRCEVGGEALKGHLVENADGTECDADPGLRGSEDRAGNPAVNGSNVCNANRVAHRGARAVSRTCSARRLERVELGATGAAELFKAGGVGRSSRGVRCVDVGGSRYPKKLGTLLTYFCRMDFVVVVCYPNKWQGTTKCSTSSNGA
ncbi:hypothetical protein BJ912DRAFT_1044829, partial [Pholiota molesta]